MTEPTPKPESWDGFFAALAEADVPDDFLSERSRDQGVQDRDPFADWIEDEARNTSSMFADDSLSDG